MDLIFETWRRDFEQERRAILYGLPEINVLRLENLEERDLTWRRRQLPETGDDEPVVVNEENISYCWWLYFRCTADEDFIVLENRLITLNGLWWLTIEGNPTSLVRHHGGVYGGFVLVPLLYRPLVPNFGFYMARQCMTMFLDRFLPLVEFNNDDGLEWRLTLNPLNRLYQHNVYIVGIPDNIQNRTLTDFELLTVVNPRVLRPDDLFRLSHCFHSYCATFIEYLNKWIRVKGMGIGDIPGGIDYITYYYFLYFLFVIRPSTIGEALDMDEYSYYRDLATDVHFFRQFIREYDFIRHEAQRYGYNNGEYYRKRTLELFYVEILANFQMEFFEYVNKESKNGLRNEVYDIWRREEEGITFQKKLTNFFLRKMIIIFEESERARQFLELGEYRPPIQPYIRYLRHEATREDEFGL